ncbi:MAG TPA: hypothetical protein VH370_26170 [Humisphaera sp.]|nr:hypothetical protein [Humisphaera sp.]
MAKTFKHSGKLGDVIFSLPTMRALGGGILYLDPEGGAKEPIIAAGEKLRHRLTFDAAAIESLRPLLSMQEYVTEVRHWNGEAVDYNLDRFRLHLADGRNVADFHLDAFGLPSHHRDKAWLRVDSPQPIPDFPVVISRTARYHGNDGWWDEFLYARHPQCAFVGLPKEHEIFEYTFGFPVRYYPTPTILDLARVIAGCQLFVSNTSLANAIAEGLKQKKILEVYRVWKNVFFNRPDAEYI